VSKTGKAGVGKGNKRREKKDAAVSPWALGRG